MKKLVIKKNFLLSNFEKIKIRINRIYTNNGISISCILNPEEKTISNIPLNVDPNLEKQIGENIKFIKSNLREFVVNIILNALKISIIS